MALIGQLTLAVLGHHDAPRFARALRSAEIAAAGAPNVRVQPVIDTCGSLGAPADSWLIEGGTAGRAKGALFSRWSETARAGDWVYQLDGDDVLYSCAAQAMQRDMAMAGADLIGHFAFDTPADGSLWSCAPAPPWPAGSGRGEHWDSYPYVTSWMPSLWSLPATGALFWAEDMPAYEDGLICYQALAAHQCGALRLCISGAVDILAVDRETPGSAQKASDMDHWADELRRRREMWVSPERSNWGEVPAITPATILTRDERLAEWKESPLA